MAHKKIALFGFFGWGNLGNTGTLQAFLHHLRHRLPGAEISCICANPEEVANHFQIPVFPIDLAPRRLWHRPTHPVLRLLHQGLMRIPLELWLWVKAYLFIQSIDLLMIPGTGVLDDFGVTPFQTPYDLFKWSLLAKLSGTKLLFVSVGAGPILHSVSRWFMRSALALADYRSYRDEFSRDYMRSVGFGLEDNGVYPDLMFSLPLPTDLPATSRHGSPCVVGVGVMEYYGWHGSAGQGFTAQGKEIYRRYITKLGQFVLWLLDHGYTVRWLIGQTHDQRAVNDLNDYLDKAYCEQGKVAPAAGQLVGEAIATTDDLFHQIAASDIVVA
jgi:polysaccharide pyruvyl transferase WcaK-like protein